MHQTVSIETTAQAYLELLRARGIDCFFGNAGTDFASIIDAFARFQAEGKTTPRPITVPHEFVAVSMAHGYYLMTGRPQVVMVHVTVGTANGLGALMNASRLNVPILFTAGRTPITEQGLPGGRSNLIHWAQESFDQASMVREYVKWDYELRNFTQLEAVVDRALAIAMTEPRGPVYLALPREVMVEHHETFTFTSPSRQQPAAPPAPDPGAIREAARLLSRAERPLVLTNRAGQNPKAVPALADLVDRFALPVVGHSPCYLNLPASHPMHLGYAIDPWLGRADCVLVLDSDVPWYPLGKGPGPDVPVIQLGPDPLFSRYPVRTHPADLAIIGDVATGLVALAEELARATAGQETRLAERRAAWTDVHARVREVWSQAAYDTRGDRPIDLRWLSACVGQVCDEQTVVVNEYSLLKQHLRLERPGSYFRSSPVSGLGWGIGAALGIKLAAPERTVIAALGDGAYLFNNPAAAHFVSAAQGLPFLAIILNNQAWGAVKQSVRGLHPNGWAASTGHYPLTYLEPSPAYERIVEAYGGYGERVEDPAQLPAALQRGLRAVRQEGRQALLNVVCKRA